MKFRLRPHNDDDSLLSSKLYDETTFYNQFLADLRRCRTEVIIESPYMTVRRCKQVAPILQKLTRRGVKVTVTTREPSDHDNLLRIQALQSTEILKSVGVRVFYFDNLHHRKLALLDGHVMFEGSLNILSQANSKEVMRRIVSQQLTSEMIKFIQLQKQLPKWRLQRSQT